MAAGGGSTAQITSNTIYQPLGDAVRVQGGTNGLNVRDNVLWLKPATICSSTPAARSASRAIITSSTPRPPDASARGRESIDRRSMPGAPPPSPIRTAWWSTQSLSTLGIYGLLGFGNPAARRPRRRFSFAEHRRKFSRWFVRAPTWIQAPCCQRCRRRPRHQTPDTRRPLTAATPPKHLATK